MKTAKKGKFAKYIKDENIKKEMAKKKYTYQIMANKMGCTSKTSFHYLLHGIVQPDIHKMAVLANELGKPVDYFFRFDLKEIESNQQAN